MADTTQPFIPDHRGGPRYLDEAEVREMWTLQEPFFLLVL